MRARLDRSRFLTVILVTSLLALLPACAATVPLATPAEDLDAKRFEVPPGKALLYIYRTMFLGSAHTYELRVDSNFIGETGKDTYYVVEVLPGMVRIQLDVPRAYAKPGTVDLIHLDIMAEPGKIHWIEQGSRPRGFPHLPEHVLSEQLPYVGMRAVSKSRLAGRIQL
jgi:hypothetical protein